MYKPIQIDMKNLTIMGISFPDLATLNRTASAIGSNMYEGFEPSAEHIALIRDYVLNKITFLQFVEAAKHTDYANLYQRSKKTVNRSDKIISIHDKM